MYNGIGLTTPRGSGTNGHVQRNWAFVRPGKKDNNYRNEEDVKKLDATLNRPPNKEILDHDRKRKMEVKCLEFEEILEKQGFTSDEIKAKVDSYRQKLMGQSKNDLPKDEFGRVAVRETHQVAEAQQQKNAKLREAFNISEYFVEGSSFNSDRKAKEDLAKSLSLQKELDAQREHTASGASAVAARCSDNQKRGYNVMRTPSKESEKQLAVSGGGGGATCSSDDHSVKKKKKKRMRESSASPERKKDKKKKSKKHKKENKPKKKKSRKCKEGITESDADSDKGSDDDDGGGDSSDSEYGIKKPARKRNKKDKKKRDKKRKRHRRSTSSEKSNNKLSSRRSIETKKSSRGELNFSKGPADNVFCSNDSRQRRTSRDKHRSSDTRRYTSSRNSRSGEGTTRQKYQDRYKSRTRRSRDRRLDDNERCSRSRQRRMGEHQQRKYSKERSISGDKRRKRNYSCSSTTPSGRSQTEKREKSCSARKNSRSRSRTHLSRRSHDRKPLDKMKRSRSCSNSPRIKKRKQYSISPSVQRELNQDNKKNVSNEVKRNKSSEKKNMTAAFRVKNDSRKSHSSSNTNTLSDSDSSRQSRPPDRGAEKSKVIMKSKSFENAKGSTEKLYRSPSQKDATLPQKQCRRDDSRKSTDCNNPRNVISSSSNERTLKKSKTPTSVPAPLHKTKSDIKASRSLSRDSSELSYSPARRNPERYRDILETSGKHKSDRYEVENRRGNNYKQRKQSHNARSTNKRGNDDFEKDKPTSSRREIDNRHERDRGNVSKLAPVVRLHSQSEGENDSDGNPEHNADNMASALNEFQESRRERELKELKMLEHLKTGIAAKAKEKIKTIEKMAAIGGSSGMAGSEVSNICGYGRRSMRHTLNETFSDNTSIVITSSNTNTNTTNKNKNDNRSCNKDAAIYPQNRPDIKIEQLSPSHTPDDLGSVNKEDNETQANCKQSHTLGANGHAYTSPTETETTTTTTTMTTTTSTFNNIQIQPNNNIKDRGRKREYEREPDKPDSNNYNRDRNYNYKRDRDNERSRRSPLQQQQQYGPNSANMVGGVGMTVGRRQQHLYYRGRHNGNTNNNGGGAAGHPLLTHASSTSHSQNCGGHGLGALMPCPPYAHPINTSTALTYNRPSRINNTPLITATQFNNQMLCKQSGNVLVGRRSHRTALSLGLSGTPTTNFTNSNLLLTKANALHLQGHHPHHHHHHHHQHHHHHHSSSSSNTHINHTSTQITDRILMAASLAAAGQHNHALTYNHNAATAVNSLSYLQQQQQQQKSKILIKPFKINHDSQPLVAALADSTLVDTIVSKVSTATVRAQESAARRSRSRSRRSRSRSRHHDSTGRRSKSRSRSRSSSSSSRTRSRSSRSRSHSHSSKSSTSSRSSSCSSSSSSSGLTRSGSRSPSIPRRRGSPSFLDRRRITSARKRPIPYHRKTPSDITSCYCSSCCSRDSSQRSHSFSPMQNSRSPSTMIF